MSIINIARECGWKSSNSHSKYVDPCAVCLESRCTVAAEGCFHECCTNCALYLCSTNRTSNTATPPGSIACSLCRRGIVSFVKLESTMSLVKEAPRTSLSLPFCACSVDGPELSSHETPFCKPEMALGSSFCSLCCQKFPSVKFNPGLCMGSPDTSPCLVPRNIDRSVRNQMVKCSRLSFRRSTSQNDPRRWLCSFSQSIETGS